jgi:hypothetical protein
MTLQIISILGAPFGPSSLMDSPKRLSRTHVHCKASPRPPVTTSEQWGISNSLRVALQPVCRSFLVKIIITTLQGAYIILQSLSLKIALQKCRCFWPGHMHISLHCMVAGSKMPCNALRSFYEMKPSSADFQKGTV